MSTSETGTQIQDNRSQQVLESECFPECPENGPKGVTENTHNTHTRTYTHIQDYGTGRDMSFVYGQAMEPTDTSVHKYRHTQAHKVMYPKSGTHTLPRQVLPPWARASL